LTAHGRTADIIIIGGGVVGCSTAYHLSKLGAKNVILLERGDLCAGGTAKSCAIVRTHYSIGPNLVHAVESLKVFSDFDEAVGGDIGWRQTGYLIVGPERHRAPMEAVFRMQNELGIDTAVIGPEEASEVHPLLQFEDVGVIGFDTQAGYADPYLTTMAFANRAKELGTQVFTETAVTGIRQGGGISTVETDRGSFEAANVVMTAGPWTRDLGRMLGVAFPYVNSRHKVITLKTETPYELHWPIVKDLTTPDKIYFRSETGGVVLVGTGDHGDPIDDPDSLRDHVELDHVTRIDSLITHRMPSFADAQYVAGWTGPYDITPDWNPIVGPVPGCDGVFVAVGFSGHGFKLAPTISEGLAQTVLGQEPRVPIDSYGIGRFEEGAPLHGAYGIGSIS
jgi:sarcosine oxidase subunit beta